MADDQNIDVNINTVVDRESFDQLNGDLTDLQEKSINIPVDSTGMDDLKNNVGGADTEVNGLNNDLKGIDGSSAQEASNQVSTIGTSAEAATASVQDLTEIMKLISSAIAVGGVVMGINSIASSADDVNEKMNAMQINFNLDPSGLAVASDEINKLNTETGVAKSSIRDLDNGLGLAGVTSTTAANGVIKVAAQLSYLKTGSNDATEGIASMFTRSITSGKMADRAFASNGISLDQMAQRAGMTKDSMTALFATMSADERAQFLEKYAVDVNKADEANEGLKDSYDTLKDEAIQKLGAVGTAFGQMVLPILIPALNIAIGALSGLAGAINGLPDWAKTAGGVAILSIGLGIIGAVIWSTVIPAISAFVAGAIVGFTNMILPILGVNASVFTLEGAFASLAAVELVALAPALLVVAAILAIGAAIYFVGQYFGWWKDLPGMFDAIKAGVMRLWNAFINNAQVQGVIEWLKTAWQGVMDFLQPVFAALTSIWNNIFPPQDGGFDIVNSIIMLFGWLGTTIAGIVAFIQANWPLVSIALAPILAPLNLIISVLALLRGAWGTVISYMSSGASQINGYINSIRDAWNSFTSGFMSAYNTYVKPAVDALQSAASAANSAWNAINGGSSGGSAGGYAAGGSSAGGPPSTIQYPEQNNYEINFNGLVTEQSMIDYLLDLIGKGKDQDDMRT
jgi:hypothetical protein